MCIRDSIKRLLKKCPQGIVKGIDYSPVSVEKSKKVNEAAIAEGRCAVLQGSVADMVFADDWFDTITAFETVYFWPDLLQCFREEMCIRDRFYAVCERQVHKG